MGFIFLGSSSPRAASVLSITRSLRGLYLMYCSAFYIWKNRSCILLVWIPPYINMYVRYNEILGTDSLYRKFKFVRCRRGSRTCESSFLTLRDEILRVWDGMSTMILNCWSFVWCVFVSRPFSTIKVTNKNRLFRNRTGTPYSRHCLFKLRKRADRQQESWRAQLEF